MSSTLLAACAGGILFAAPFVFPALFPLAWVSLLPLLWAIGRASGPRQAFFSGWLTGLSANLAGFHWLTYTISIFGGFSYTVSGFIFLVFAAGAGLLFALFALAVRLCGFGPLYLFPPLFWVAAEFLFPQLFPWHFANSQSRFLTFIQSADLVGPYGTSFLLVWCNALLFHWLFARKRARPITYLPATVFAAVVFVILAYGSFRLSTVTAQMQAAPKLSLSAIQGNIDIGLKWNPDQARNNLNLYHELTRKSEDASLVVWPETAIEVWLPDDITQLPPDLLPLFHSATRFFIFGVRSFRGEPGRPDFRAFN
ncbi:MAG: apolipoprotein N-acyltransferase, partial [Candidatus Binatia bacterium]